MTQEKARKLVAKELPEYIIQGVKQSAGVAKDTAGSKPTVELISPTLRSLKRRYFGDNAAPAPVAASDSDDSGIVVVEKKAPAGKRSTPQAIVFSKGKIIGRQG
jgi:hypothetical protein